MIEGELRFVDDDKLIAYTPIPHSDGMCKIQLVMTKEIFKECYKKWIEPQEESSKIGNNDQGRVSIDPKVIKKDRELQIRNQTMINNM